MSPLEHSNGEIAARGKGIVDRDSVVQWSKQPVSAAVGEEVVLMNLDRGRCYGLGPVGTDLWSKMSQPIRVSTLLEQLSQEYSAEPEVLERDVLEVLEQYATEGLIEVSEATGA
jgi:hypothetical protein